MSFGSVGLDFMGGAEQGAGTGALISTGLAAAGAANPYTMPLIAGMAGLGALQRVMAGASDDPAQKMNLRLGQQQVAMNDLDLQAKQAALEEQRRQKRKMRAAGDILSGIFSRYQAQGA